MASNPLKLRGIRRPHEPKPFGPALKHLYLLRGHAGDDPDCITPRPSFMPQATERARNGEADQRRTTDSASPLDSIRRLIQRVVIRFSYASERVSGAGLRPKRGRICHHSRSVPNISDRDRLGPRDTTP